MTKLFFGYPHHPIGPAEVMRETARKLEAQTDVSVRTWQDLMVDGRVVVHQILNEIVDCDAAIFDLTYPNQNVAFELAYALAKGVPVRITIDNSIRYATAKFNEVATLKPIGYTPYFNSDQLVAKLLDQAPWADESTAYDDVIEPNLPDVSEPRNNILYCPTFEPFEASSRLSSFIDDRGSRGIRVIVSDPHETSFEPVTWTGSSIMKSAGVLVHFAGDERNRSEIFNTRHAITAGLAIGLDTPILMLAEAEYPRPFDYEDLLKTYAYPRECVQYAREWLEELSFDAINWRRKRVRPQNPLVKMKFGEHVAENEVDDLAEYFVETSAFYDVVNARDTIFVGHRGTGKTANALQALDQLRANKTNLVVLIKPPSFEFPAMFDTVMSLPEAQHDYFFDALWRFVIQTEVAAEVMRGLESRGGSVPLSGEESEFVKYAESAPFDLNADISTRLEQTLNGLASRVDDQESSPGRNLINESFHTGALNRLRAVLGGVLKRRKRVAILVDNLDKGWDRNADLSLMATFILGLLVARGNVVRDFSREDWWRDKVRLTVSIFLRSDIYEYLRSAAREPDKLPISSVEWRDSETLLNVLESRYYFNAPSTREPTDVWRKVFCANVDGRDTKDYIVDSVLPRPRDVLVLANAAIASAVDRGHDVVGPDDLKRARRTYSDYAYDALLVENGVTIPELRKALLCFLGAESIMESAEALSLLRTSHLPPERIGAVIKKLQAMSFLGVEIHADEFIFPQVGRDADRAEALAARLCREEGARRVKIHPAFHPYLELSDYNGNSS